jgi:hypothetical protein
MDNFEWTEDVGNVFGIVYVDTRSPPGTWPVLDTRNPGGPPRGLPSSSRAPLSRRLVISFALTPDLAPGVGST